MNIETREWARHARLMVTAGHRPDCPGRAIGPVNADRWGETEHVVEHPPPPCPGCVTPRDRALWSQLADEADRFATVLA